jgi:hypothetical protein
VKAENFCFWLQGFFELNGGAASITPEQAEQIKTHLALVFKHDPAMEHPAPILPRLPDPLRRLLKERNDPSPQDLVFYC